MLLLPGGTPDTRRVPFWPNTNGALVEPEAAGSKLGGERRRSSGTDSLPSSCLGPVVPKPSKGNAPYKLATAS